MKGREREGAVRCALYIEGLRKNYLNDEKRIKERSNKKLEKQKMYFLYKKIMYNVSVQKR